MYLPYLLIPFTFYIACLSHAKLKLPHMCYKTNFWFSQRKAIKFAVVYIFLEWKTEETSLKALWSHIIG